jgi:hypothetical protein
VPKRIALPAVDVNFDKAAADPWKWRSVALSLLFAADALWNRVRRALTELDKVGRSKLSDTSDIGLRLRGPFFLLAGLAVENFLKAIIVKRLLAGGKPVTEADVLVIFRGKHDLTVLSQRADVKLTPAERELLERLSTFVNWAGRYPVPIKKVNAQKSRVTRSDDFGRVSLFMGRLESEFKK